MATRESDVPSGDGGGGDLQQILSDFLLAFGGVDPIQMRQRQAQLEIQRRNADLRARQLELAEEEAEVEAANRMAAAGQTLQMLLGGGQPAQTGVGANQIPSIPLAVPRFPGLEGPVETQFVTPQRPPTQQPTQALVDPASGALSEAIRRIGDARRQVDPDKALAAALPFESLERLASAKDADELRTLGEQAGLEASQIESLRRQRFPTELEKATDDLEMFKLGSALNVAQAAASGRLSLNDAARSQDLPTLVGIVELGFDPDVRQVRGFFQDLFKAREASERDRRDAMEEATRELIQGAIDEANLETEVPLQLAMDFVMGEELTPEQEAAIAPLRQELQLAREKVRLGMVSEMMNTPMALLLRTNLSNLVKDGDEEGVAQTMGAFRGLLSSATGLSPDNPLFPIPPTMTTEEANELLLPITPSQRELARLASQHRTEDGEFDVEAMIDTLEGRHATLLAAIRDEPDPAKRAGLQDLAASINELIRQFESGAEGLRDIPGAGSVVKLKN